VDAVADRLQPVNHFGWSHASQWKAAAGTTANSALGKITERQAHSTQADNVGFNRISHHPPRPERRNDCSTPNVRI